METTCQSYIFQRPSLHRFEVEVETKLENHRVDPNENAEKDRKTWKSQIKRKGIKMQVAREAPASDAGKGCEDFRR